MDPALIPSLGAAAALVVVIGYLLASNRADRTQQREAMTSALARIDRLEKRVTELHGDLDAERALRRSAEDTAAAARRDVDGLRAQLDLLTKGRTDG